MNDSNHDYITIGRTFENYKWYKPLLTIIVTGVLLLVSNIIIMLLCDIFLGESFMTQFTSGYESLNTIDVETFISFASIALALPSIYIASRIIRDRPFSSYASTRGGWNWKLYFKCLLPSIAIFAIVTVASIIYDGSFTIKNQFTIVSFIAFMIMVPLQCIGEEYLFRGLLMQSLGSWFKIPVVALIVQSVIFGVLHDYNSIGVFSIILSGLLYGWIAWKTSGIEASSAIHTVNNLYVLFLAGFGLQQTSSSVTTNDLIIDAVVQVACVALIYYIGKKYDWFEA